MKKNYRGLICCVVIIMIIGGAVSYFALRDKSVKGTEIEDSAVSSNQKKTVINTKNNSNDDENVEKEPIDDNTDYRKSLIGMWHASNQLGDGYDDMYTFSDNGTFKFQYSQYDRDREIIDYSGKWVIVGDKSLTLTIDTKHILDTKVPSDGKNDQQENKKIKEIVLETPEELNLSLKDLKETEESRFPLTVKIDDICYWKLSAQQYNDKINANELEKLTKEKIKEFTEVASKAEKTPTDENIINAHIIGKVFDSLDLEESDRKWVDEKRQFLEDNISNFSVIYSGVSLNNVQFIAIIQPQMTNSFDFTETVINLRNDKKEMNILNDIMTIEPDHLYAIDLYAENLLDVNDIIEIDNLELKFDNEYELFIDEEKKEVNAYLEEYDRRVKTDLTLNDKSWNLFLFKNNNLDPDEIIIEINDELIKLTK
ncbi:hypothetical protein AN1V17_03650 [Vallitalea sediminicola]